MHKNCAGCQQKYWEVQLRSYIHMIDQLAEDQYTLDRYVETGELYDDLNEMHRHSKWVR